MPLDITKLIEAKEIIFGPFIGEFGWEIRRWCGFIRWLKYEYIDKPIVVSTRASRQDLYTGVADSLELFDIEGDYNSCIPNGYDCDNFSEKAYEKLVNDLKIKYPDALLFEPRGYKYDRDLFDLNNMDFDFRPLKSNVTLIETILKNQGNLIPIVIAPRDIKTNTSKNWGIPKWKMLFDMIQNSGKYLVFVSGFSPNYYKAYSSRKFFYNLEDYAKPELITTNCGLLIEAIRASSLVVGIQSAEILLANALGTQTFFWGDQIKTYSVLDNPEKTKSIGIQDYNYSIDPITVFNNIKKMTS